MNSNTVSKYVDAITAEAQQAQQQVISKLAEYKAEQIAKFEKNEQIVSEFEIKRKIDAIREDVGREFSEKEVVLRKVIFNKRDEIFTKVFDNASEKLKQFTATPEYKSFIVNSAVEIKKNLIGRDKSIKIYLRECDFEYSKEIEEAFSFPCEFLKDNSIKIGGIKAKFSSVVIDDTLDARLYSQKSWFEENSGLDIK